MNHMAYRIMLLLAIAAELLAVTELQRHKRSYRKCPDDRTRRLLSLNRISLVAGAAIITLLTVIVSRK